MDKHTILTISVTHWLLLLSAFACIAGFTLLSEVGNSNQVSETFTARVVDVWVRYTYDHTGGSEVYYVRLERDQIEYTCTVSAVLRHLWNRLETGQSYEFAVTRSRMECSIYAAVEVSETQRKE